jgi:hypothetical protein
MQRVLDCLGLGAYINLVGGCKVKKLSALALTFSVWTLGAPVLTQCQPRQSSQQHEKKPELVNIKGTVRADGNKITIGGIISGVRSFLKKWHSEIAIFGEMVALLAAQGKIDAALQLEQLWNDLAMKHSFSLRCAYPIANFSGDKNTQPLIRVCAEHSAVLFDEGDESTLGGNSRIALCRS